MPARTAESSHAGPHATCLRTRENRFDYTGRACAILERGEERRLCSHQLLPVSDDAVNVACHVEEGVGPALLMSSRQPRKFARGLAHERRILLQKFVRPMPTPDPELVLLL